MSGQTAGHAFFDPTIDPGRINDANTVSSWKKKRTFFRGTLAFPGSDGTLLRYYLLKTRRKHDGNGFGPERSAGPCIRRPPRSFRKHSILLILEW
jgi:hypothetical protein